MITIEQLLESVNLNFEPRWVTKDKNGMIKIFECKPKKADYYWLDEHPIYGKAFISFIKLTEFDGKDWTECIYEVPRKTTGEIEKFTLDDFVTVVDVENCVRSVLDSRVFNKLNGLVDMVNNIISVQEKMIDSRFVVDTVNELKGAKNE